MYVQSRNLGEIDWSALLKEAVGGYAAVKTVQAQTDLVKLQAKQQQEAQNALLYQLNPQYSPSYGVPGAPSTSSNIGVYLLLGGAALALYFLMKD